MDVHLLRCVCCLTAFWIASCLPASGLFAQQNSTDGSQPDTQLADAAERQDWDRVAEFASRDVNLDQIQPDGMTALHWAVFYQNDSIVRKLLESGAGSDQKTAYDVTPLRIAAKLGDAKNTRLLLDAGADPNDALPGGERVLMTAARTGNAEVVRLLLNHGATPDATERKGQTALMWAAAAGHAEVVDELIRVKVDLNKTSQFGFSALMFAARQGKTDVVMRLLDAGVDVNSVMEPTNSKGRNPRNKMSALMFAVENGHFELALKLIDKGADPNDQRSGYAPLHALSWVRKTKVGDNPDGDPPPRGSGSIHSLQFVKSAVAAGADVNLQLSRGAGGRAQLNTRGATPFLMAARTADIPLMKLLLELGADPQLTNVDGCNALMAAAGVGVTAVGEEPGTVAEVEEAIRMLVEIGVDINAVDENGETAMHGAAYRNYPETVSLLADLKADPAIWNRKNKYGWTPRMIASGIRPGSFKPSPVTIAALDAALGEAD